MADEPQISILDARLAEIDRRLRTIQTGLADESGPAPGGGPEAATGLPPRIAVPEPGGRSGSGAGRPVALAPPAVAPPAHDEVGPAHDESSDEDPALVIAELRGLISDHARLLDAMGELLASGERLLARAHAPVPPAAPPPAPPAPPARSVAPQVTVTAGPFSNLEAVRDFERALGALPNVAAVDVRGYEGEDRAMVDVHLSRPNP